MRVVIAGGGAAGCFAALACAETASGLEVVVLEKSPEPLAKVAISGGGRCNVTHDGDDPRALAEFYPRGRRELVGPLTRWGPRDTVRWFEARGVPIKAEPDGRMFPASDSSASITGALLRALEQAGVRLRTRAGLRAARRTGAGFRLELTDGGTLDADRLVLATGGNAASGGFEIAAALGHTILPPVPSLFTFHVDDARLRGLQGLSAPDAVARAPVFRLRQRGPVLITHWGLSGPAILRLSAWGARALHDAGYDFELRLDWTGLADAAAVRGRLEETRASDPRRHAGTAAPFALPNRLWRALLHAAGVAADSPWAAVSNDRLRALAGDLADGSFRVRGRSLFKDEFVTCGGIALREIDFRTMASRVCPGLYAAGELLDIDGVTGGFNLQAAWTTGRLAGEAIARGA